MSTVDLGGNSSSLGYALKYSAIHNGGTITPNNRYLLSVFVNTVVADDSSVDVGDVIELASDYTTENKTVTFSHPVVIGNTLYGDGVITFNDKLTLWFDGQAWVDNFNSTAVLIDVGTKTFTDSSQITVDTLADNFQHNIPLHITLQICAGGGVGGAMYSNTGNIYSGGGAGAFLALEFVSLDKATFPVIDVLIGSRSGNVDYKYPGGVNGKKGGDSQLKLNGQLIADILGGGAITSYGSNSLGGIEPIPQNVDNMLNVVASKGGEGKTANSINEGNVTSRNGEDIATKYGVFMGEKAHYSSSGNYTYYYRYGGGGASAMGGGGVGYGAGGRNNTQKSGVLIITYRPATVEEIAAQEALNAS